MTVIARALGFAPARAGPVVLDSATTKVPALRLAPQSVLAGRIIDEFRRPVPKASVAGTSDVGVKDTLAPDGHDKTVTGKAGDFLLTGLEQGTYSLTVRADGFASRTVRGLRLDRDDTQKGMVIELYRGTYLTGRTVDGSGRPIARALLDAAPGPDEHVQTESDEDGRFRLGPFARGARVYLHTTAAGYTPTRTDDVIAPTDALVVQLSRNGAFRGQVMDANSGRPIASFKIAFHHRGPLRSGEYPGVRTFQSRDGRFEWRDVHAGTWNVTVDASGYLPRDVYGLFISSGQESQEISILLEKGQTFRGRVFDIATGVGIASAAVGYRVERQPVSRTLDTPMSSVLTDAEGIFELGAVPAEPVILFINASSYVPESRSVDPSGNGFVEIGLASGGAIFGQLVSARGSTAVAGVVSLESTVGGPGAIRNADDEGRFAFTQLQAGPYLISAETKQGQATAKRITLAEHEQVTGFMLRLDSGSNIGGIVSGLLPGERGRVEIEAQGPQNFHARTTADDRGSYTFHGVPLGAIEVAATTPAGRSISRTAELARVGDVTLNFEFPAGYRVSGRVTRAGKAVRFAQLSALPLDDQGVTSAAETSQSGQYTMEGLPKGNYSIQAQGGRAVRLYVANDSTLDIELPDLSVAGVIVDASTGAALSDSMVEIRSLVGGSASSRVIATSNYKGEFTLVGLESGDYQLSAYKTSYDLEERKVSVTGTLSGLQIPLRSTSGVSVKVRDASTRAPMSGIWVIEMIGGRNGTRLQMLLDESGSGSLPPSLAGRDFLIAAFGYLPRQVTRWNGSSLEVLLSPETN